MMAKSSSCACKHVFQITLHPCQHEYNCLKCYLSKADLGELACDNCHSRVEQVTSSDSESNIIPISFKYRSVLYELGSSSTRSKTEKILAALFDVEEKKMKLLLAGHRYDSQNFDSAFNEARRLQKIPTLLATEKVAHDQMRSLERAQANNERILSLRQLSLNMLDGIVELIRIVWLFFASLVSGGSTGPRVQAAREHEE